jgi:hypothetical protein
MNFTFTWIMDKLGYIPKINMEVGKVNLDLSVPNFSKPVAKKTTTRKPAAKKTVAKKAK